MHVKIKPRHEILNDIIRDSRKHSSGWKAAFGKDTLLHSKDCYIIHPDVGVYVLKEYQKNPYQTNGVGTKIARKLDDDIDDHLLHRPGNFGIILSDMRKIAFYMQKGVQPEKIFYEGLHGNDLGITVPVKGKASTSQETFTAFRQNYQKKERHLNEKFEQILSDDRVLGSYQ